MTESEYGNLSTLLADHQGLLRKGDLVCVLSTGGSWNDYQVHGKNKGCWVNVSDVGGSEPTISVRLLPGGRWYRIDTPGERLDFLGEEVEPIGKDTTPLLGDQGACGGPTILGAGTVEAGGGLTTPVDRDNTSSFSQLIPDPLHDADEENLARLIPALYQKHSNLPGIEKLESGMHLLVTALSELAGINPTDPDSDTKISQAELKEAQLFQFLKDQIASINQRTINDDESIATLERDLIAFMETYRTRKIHLIQVLKQTMQKQGADTQNALQTSETRFDTQDDKRTFQSTPQVDNGARRKVIVPSYAVIEEGSDMDLDNLDDGYVEATDISLGKSLVDAERIKTLEETLRLDRERWDRYNDKVAREIQNLRLENESLRRAQARDPAGCTKPGSHPSKDEVFLKQVNSLLKQTEDEAGKQESFQKDLMNKLSGFTDTKFKAYGFPVPAPTTDPLNVNKTAQHVKQSEKASQEGKLPQTLEAKFSDIQDKLVDLEVPRDGATRSLSEPRLSRKTTNTGNHQGTWSMPPHIQKHINLLQEQVDQLSHPATSIFANSVPPGRRDIDENQMKAKYEGVRPILRNTRFSEPDGTDNGSVLPPADHLDDLLNIEPYDSPTQIGRDPAGYTEPGLHPSQDEVLLKRVNSLLKRTEDEAGKRESFQKDLMNKLSGFIDTKFKAYGFPVPTPTTDPLNMNKTAQHAKPSEGYTQESRLPQTLEAKFSDMQDKFVDLEVPRNGATQPLSELRLSGKRTNTGNHQGTWSMPPHIQEHINFLQEQVDQLSHPAKSIFADSLAPGRKDIDENQMKAKDESVRPILRNTRFSEPDEIDNGSDLLPADHLDDLLNIEPPDSPTQIGIFPSESALQGILEELDELSAAIDKLNKNTERIISNGHDGKIKSHRNLMNTKFERLCELSRRCRNKLKKEARSRLGQFQARELINGQSMTHNLDSVTKMEQILEHLDEKIEARGLDLFQTGAATDIKTIWPTFTGSDLPLVHSFLSEIQTLMIDTGTPVSKRGTILAQSVKNEAKTILANHDFVSKNPSFESQAAVLKDHFGQAGSQMSLLTRLHQGQGEVPAVGDKNQPISRIHNAVKGHLKLLRAARDLQERFDKGEIPENPISSCYLNAVEDFLPRDSVNKLTDIEGYTSTLSTRARFELIISAFKSVQNWSSFMIARHGNNGSESESKKKPRAPQTTLVAATDHKASVVNGSGGPHPPIAPPQFTGSPPMPPAPLYGPPPQIPSSVCYYCKKPGHWASNCPDKRNGKPVSQTIYNGQSVSLTPFGDGQSYFKADLTCFVCQHLPQSSVSTPSMHIFTKNGRLERTLCPRLVALPTMEDRCKALEESDVCLACLNGRLSDHQHGGRLCNSLDISGMHALKCYHVGCKKRWALCVTHKQDNSQNIANYKKRVQEHLQMNLSLITTVALAEGDNKSQGVIEDTVNLNTNPSSLSSRVYSGIQELVNSSKTPILHINENSFTFMLFLMKGKDEDNPVVVCFDTGSAFTLIREDALAHKIHGPSVKLPGNSSVVGIGGKQAANNYYCSVPLDKNRTGGFCSKIISCLSVQQIVEIDTLDTTKLVRYLKREYKNQLPADFDLFNFRSLGSRIKLDALIGIQELQVFPQLILQTPCGLSIYKVPIMPAQRSSSYCIAGNLPDLNEEDLHEETGLVSLTTKPPMESVNLGELRQAWDANLSDPNFVDIMDDQCRSSLLTTLHSELERGIHDSDNLNHPTLIVEASNEGNQDGEEQAKREAKKIRPSFIVSSPIPQEITESVKALQKLMINYCPSLQQFLVPPSSLHVTHLVLGCPGDFSEFSEKLRQPILQLMPHDGMEVTVGKIVVLNGNVCISIHGANLISIQRLLQQACRDNGTYFDSQQTHHITIFKRDHKQNLQPCIKTHELRKFGLSESSFSLNYIDFCKIKRADKSEYFSIDLRINCFANSVTPHPTVAPRTLATDTASLLECLPQMNILKDGVLGLCSEHRALLNTLLPLIGDWRSIESTESIINDIYQPFGLEGAVRDTIPSQLFQLQDRTSAVLPYQSSDLCLSSNKIREDKVKNLLDESVSHFRCLSCKLCSSCSRSSQVGGPTLTLRSEVENLLIKNSVSIDLRTNRIVAKHVLPSNFKELLGDNRKECERRLRIQLQKLAKRPEEEKIQVQQSIQKLITRGFVCTRNEFSEEERRAVEENEGPYTLPVSIVFKSGSLSSPSRVCLDGSARTSTGYSLNCLLPKGALSLSIGSLVQVWKGFPVVASGDLSSFYCRFSLDASHWGLQKFFWVDDLNPAGPTTTYFVRTIIFGIKSSGLICHYGLTKLIEVFDCLKACVFYVDDCIAHYYDLDHAKDEIKKISDILDKYNLPFKSGGLSLVGQVPSPEVVNEAGEIAISSVRWNPVTDHFRCNIPTLFMGQTDRGSLAKVQICPGTTAAEIYAWLPETFTLKDLLSKVASHFDSSLGILTGLIAPMRHLVRRVMIESKGDGTQTNWEFVLTAQHRKQFARQLAEAKKVGTFSYPRFPPGESPIIPNNKGTLICFTDAADFESAVIYLGLQQQDGTWRFLLITARSYLIQSGMTIAKSELQAAAHGATATQSVLDNFAGRLSLEPVLLLDSQCSMQWVSNGDSLLHTFHRNRVLAIASVFGKNIFYVPSKLNIADDISRESVTAQTVSPDSRFYKGPEFLKSGIEAAQSDGFLTPLSAISKENMTPELLEVFRSGIVLSKFQDLNFMALKKQVKEDQKIEDENHTSPVTTTNPEDPLQRPPSEHIPDITSPTGCPPSLSSLSYQSFSENRPLKEISRQIALRNAGLNPDTPKPYNHPILASEFDPDQPLYCTACSKEVPHATALYFYSQCRPELGHHAYGHLTHSQVKSVTTLIVSDNFASHELVRLTPSSTREINQLITTRNMSRGNDPVALTPDVQVDLPTQNHLPCRAVTGDATPAPAESIENADRDLPSARENGLNKLNWSTSHCWTKRTRELSSKVQYLINPIGLSLPKLCRAGATALRFVYLILDSLSRKQSKGPWKGARTRIFLDPSCVRKICLTITGSCPANLDLIQDVGDGPEATDISTAANYHRIHANYAPTCAVTTGVRSLQADTFIHRAKRTPPLHGRSIPFLYILSRQIEKEGWMKYPGILNARRMARRWKTLLNKKHANVNSTSYQTIIDELECFQRLVHSFRQHNCRQTVQRLGDALTSDLAHMVRVSWGRRGFKEFSDTRPYQLLKDVTGCESAEHHTMSYSPCINFVQVMSGSYTQSCYFTGLTFRQLVLQEQRYISTEWASKKRVKYCLSQNGVMVFNTRMSEHVCQKSSVISGDPDSTDFSKLIPDLECPVLDKNSPLYISIARYVHYQLDLPTQPSAGLFQKHRGASQNHMLSLRFCFAPGGLAVFKRIQNCCFVCRVRMRKYVKTSEGDVHHSQLVFVKPFQSSHLDLMGPLIMKIHRSMSTRKNSNEKKIWLLVIVCSITRAIWTEIMYGTSAADFSDALTRAMTVLGSITHVVTDRSATQLKVLREGKFLEQIKCNMYKRLGWYFEQIPVSQHRWNGLVEGRISSLREMLAFPENKVPMTILNFLTHLRLATSLLNSVPFAHSFEGGTANPELKILSPASFLYPLNSLHRPILSPITIDGGNDGYFDTIQAAYQQMIAKFMDAVVPIIAKKYHKYYQSPGHELSEGDIVLFKKRPNATFLPGWCLGRVDTINKSRDQRVRSIKIVYICNRSSDQDEDPYETSMEGKRIRLDKNLSRVETVRESDEVIKLHPIDSKEKDMYKELEKILVTFRAATPRQHQ